jgi:uncharacterized membrane protein
VNILELLKQRRVWVAILSILSVVLKIFGIDIDEQTQTAMIDQTMILASLIPDVFNAVLALWSYIKPKPKA